MIVLVVWFANGDGSALTSKASSKVSLLNDKRYLPLSLCDRYCVILEQGVHHIRKSLIFSTGKAFLEHAIVELVYKSMRNLP